MALTVVKYRKTATGEVSAATPAILIKSKLQPQLPQQQQQQQQQQHQPQQHQQIVKKPIIKLEGGTNLIINKIPATIKPAAMKRNNTSTVDPTFKAKKYSLQTIASTGTPLTSFQWQQTIGGPGGTTITATTPSNKQQQIGAAISSLPPNTIITSGGTPLNTGAFIQTNGSATVTPTANAFSTLTTPGTTLQVRRPTIYIKREVPKRTIRSVTIELIEKNPFVHLGVLENRLQLLKNFICTTAKVTLLDCYITLKKLRQNEDFTLLAEYFEMSELEVQQVFVQSIVKLARYLRFLVRWPNSKEYYDRHKNLPFAFRSSLSHVQSLIECVETDMRPLQIDCSNYKFILSITPNGIISYVSEVYAGHNDDLTIFNASNFNNVIPKYLSLVVDPGRAIRRKRKPKSSKKENKTSGESGEKAETDSTTDSADESADDLIDETEDTDSDGHMLNRYTATRVAAELASHQTLSIVNSELHSRKVKDFTVPTMRVREPICRQQIRQMIQCLRDYKILQPYAIQEPLLCQYLSEIVVVAAALTNLYR